MVQFGAVLAVPDVWLGVERVAAWLGRRWIRSGRGLPERVLRGTGFALGLFSAPAILAGIAALALWSIAARWQFPALAPDALTLRSWTRLGPDMIRTAAATLAIAGTATALSLAFVAGCLEAEHRFGLTTGQRALWLLYLPLLIPQVACLPGLRSFPRRSGRGTSCRP